MGLQFSSGNDTVDRVGQIDFTIGGDGCNVIPATWYKTICYDNGKANLNAIVILSEIVYWYKPTVKRDEITGEIKEWGKKFKRDKLQKNYQSLANQYGLTKRQVQDAVTFLVHLGVIERELRNIIDEETGVALSNVVFLDINVDRLMELSYPESSDVQNTLSRSNVIPVPNVDKTKEKSTDVIPLTLERDTPYVRTGDTSRFNGRTPTLERDTYTYTTTKTTTKTSSSSNQRFDDEEEKAYRELVAENICLPDLMQMAETDKDRKRYQMLYEIICKVVCSTAKTMRINSEELPKELVKGVFLKIGYDEIVYVCEKLDEPKEKPIGNLESYIKTLLYNAHTTQGEYWTQKINYDFYGGGADERRRKMDEGRS